MILSWLHRLLNSERLDPWVARRLLRSAGVLRPYRESDFSRCVELYQRNEPGRFPPGILPNFEAALKGETTRFIVFEDDQQQIVGCGGIGIQMAGEGSRAALLAFGLVDPSRHGSGIGSALLLGRLTTLPESDWCLILFAVATSRTFYEEFGFRHVPNVPLPEEFCSFVYRTTIYLSDQRACRDLLECADIDLQLDGFKVPVTALPKST